MLKIKEIKSEAVKRWKPIIKIENFTRGRLSWEKWLSNIITNSDIFSNRLAIRAATFNYWKSLAIESKAYASQEHVHTEHSFG